MEEGFCRVPEKRSEDVRASLKELAKEAMQTYERLNELLRQGNWAGYGEDLRKLGRILKQMAK